MSLLSQYILGRIYYKSLTLSIVVYLDFLLVNVHSCCTSCSFLTVRSIKLILQLMTLDDVAMRVAKMCRL